jgi:hypothetical protein
MVRFGAGRGDIVRCVVAGCVDLVELCVRCDRWAATEGRVGVAVGLTEDETV